MNKKLTPLEKRLLENTQWGDSNYDTSIDNCQYCLKPFGGRVSLWVGIAKIRGEEVEGNLLDNLNFHNECIFLYKRIKALVFRQCSTEELEEELKGRKWLYAVFAKVRQDLKNENEERKEAKILANGGFY